MAWRLDELRLMHRMSKPLRKRVGRALKRLRSRQGIVTSWREMLETVFGIAVQDTSRGVVGSRLIHPVSNFNMGFEFLMSLLLLYNLFIIPVQLSFWTTDEVCEPNPTLIWDVFVDTFFMFDVLYRFFVGIHYRGNYCDSIRMVFIIQISSLSLFWFNVVTSVPVAWLDWYSTQVLCMRGEEPSNRNFQVFRILKPLRLIKLFRLLRVSSIYRKIKEMLDVHPYVYRSVAVLVTMVFALHFFSCVLWRIKWEVDKAALDHFLSEKGLSGESKIENYIMCMYFVCTMFTTVGFGDIYALNTAERVYCIITMLVAAFLFGALLGQLQEVVASMSRTSKEVEDRVEDVSRFLAINRIPRVLMNEIKAWIRFKHSNDQEDERMQYLLQILPNELGSQVANKLNQKLFCKIFLFQKILDPLDRAAFAAALLPKMQFSSFPFLSVVAFHKDPAHRLIALMSGKVAMSLPKLAYEPPGKRPILRVLMEGEGIGDSSVIGDLRWAGGYGVTADFIAMENCHVAFIETTDIQEALAKFPRLDRVKKLFDALAYTAPTEPVQNGADSDRSIKATYHWINLARLGRQRIRGGWTGLPPVLMEGAKQIRRLSSSFLAHPAGGRSSITSEEPSSPTVPRARSLSSPAERAGESPAIQPGRWSSGDGSLRGVSRPPPLSSDFNLSPSPLSRDGQLDWQAGRGLEAAGTDVQAELGTVQADGAFRNVPLRSTPAPRPGRSRPAS